MDLFNFTIQNKVMFAIVVLWTIPWKGFALWRAANRKEKWWFIILFLVNTFGILEILYIFVFTKWIDKKKDKQEELPFGSGQS